MSVANGTTDIGSLLVSPFSEGADVDAIDAAAAAELDPLVFGIQAVGYAIWHLGVEESDTNGIDREELANLGWLIQTLGRQIYHLQILQSNAREKSHERALEKKGLLTMTEREAEILANLRHMGTPRKSAKVGQARKARHAKRVVAKAAATA